MGKESEAFRAALDADEIKRGSWVWYPGLKDWVPIESFRDVEPLISESNFCSNPWYLPHHGFSAESFGAIEDAEAPGPDDWSVFDGPFFGARRVLKGESFRWVVDKENEGYCWWVAVRPYESDDSIAAAHFIVKKLDEIVRYSKDTRDFRADSPCGVFVEIFGPYVSRGNLSLGKARRICHGKNAKDFVVGNLTDDALLSFLGLENPKETLWTSEIWDGVPSAEEVRERDDDTSEDVMEYGRRRKRVFTTHLTRYQEMNWGRKKMFLCFRRRRGNRSHSHPERKREGNF